jgi:hypothetical protein
VNAKIEDTGIKLTAFLLSDGRKSVEKQIYERQQLLLNVCDLSKSAHKAVKTARAELDKAPRKQEKHVAAMNSFMSKAKKSRLHVVECDEDE